MGNGRWSHCRHTRHPLMYICSVLQCVAVCCTVLYARLERQTGADCTVVTPATPSLWFIVCCSVLHSIVCAYRETIKRWLLCCHTRLPLMYYCVVMCCNVLQCVAVCCSVLQCVAVCCRAWRCRVLSPFPYVYLSYVAVCCSVLYNFVCAPRETFGRWLHCRHTRHSLMYIYRVLQCVAACCSVLQCVTVCCNVLQCVTVCCHSLMYIPLIFHPHTHMGWLRLVGSIKSYDSSAEYSLFYRPLLQKRPIILWIDPTNRSHSIPSAQCKGDIWYT